VRASNETGGYKWQKTAFFPPTNLCILERIEDKYIVTMKD